MATEQNNDPLVHSQLSHFKILAKIGEGGMGSVYKAMDLRLQRTVALKFLSPTLIQNEKALRRFQLEAIAASAINHPNICIIYDVETVPPHHFIVMEYVNGSTLRAILEQQGRLSEGDVAWLLEQICPPLALAHEAGIVHRDIKPDNIMVVPEPPHVKITDFGLAKLAAETAEVMTAAQDVRDAEESQPAPVFSPDTMITTLSGLMGTTYYMSPEQVKREAVDFRSDIFSIGTMLFELLTGLKLFDGPDQISVLERIANFEDVKPAAAQAGIPHAWLPILSSCLQKDPGQRYQSVNALHADVSRLKQHLRPTHSLYSEKKEVTVTRRGRIKKWLVWPALAVIILIISVFGARRWMVDSTAKPDPDSALIDSVDVTTTSAEAYRYFLKGRQAWWRYDDAGAIQHLQMAIEADSSFAYAHCLLSVLYYWHDRDTEAHNCIQVAARQLARLTDWEKLLVQGFLVYAVNDYHNMLQFFDELVMLYPDKIDGYLCAALACEGLRDYDKAIDYLQQLLEIDSSHIAAHGNMANMYEWKGDLVNALHYAQQYLQLILDSGDLAGVPTAYEFVGMYHHFLGNPDEAIPYLQKSLEIDPVNKEASQMLAEVYALEGRMEAAEKVLKSALAIPLKDIERTDLYSFYGRLAAFGGRFVDALTHFEKEKTLATEENKLQIYMWICYDHALIYSVLQQYQMIRHELNSLISVFDLKDDDLAKWKRFLEIEFQYALDQKDFSSCKRWLEEGKEARSKGWYVSASADLALEEGDMATAEKLYLPGIEQIARPFDGQGIKANYQMAKIKLAAGNYEEAIKYCESALAARHIFNFTITTIYYVRAMALLAEIYEAWGDYEKALAQCERFLYYWRNADPGTPLLLEVQGRKERLTQKQIAGS